MPAEMLFRAVVKQELDEIVAYYEVRKPGLGLLLLDVTDILLKRIQTNPFQFQVRHKNIRKAGLIDFPYNIYFRVYRNKIVVLGILHQKRNPKLWKKRR